MIYVLKQASPLRGSCSFGSRALLAVLLVGVSTGLVAVAGADPAPTRTAPQDGRMKTTESLSHNPMASFARLIGGEWKTTAQSGTSMVDTCHWGPGKHSGRVMTHGEDGGGNPWRSLGVVYWHPGRKQLRSLSLNPYEGSVSEETITVVGETWEGVCDLYQNGVHRKMVSRTTFDGPDKYSTLLLEETAPGQLSTLNQWNCVRSRTFTPQRPIPADKSPKFPDHLKAFEPLLGRTWNAKGHARGDWGGNTLGVFHIETTFEWIPLANVIYARSFGLRGNGSPTHLLDTYFYHHTGTGRLRCLALSHLGDVYEGDATVLDGGALQFDLTGYEGDRVVPYVARLDFDENGTLRHRLWSAEGAERTPVLDAHHKASEMSRNIMVVFQDRKNNFWFGSHVQGVYRYDGKTITRFTTKDGLPSNRLEGIQEDPSGNLFFTTEEGISKFDGQTFRTLTPVKSNPLDMNWKLNPGDLWFKGVQGAGAVCRYDGESLYGLDLPKTKLGDDFESLYPLEKYPFRSNPYGVYTVYKDRKGNIWFGTAALGVCRYDGKSFAWISGSDVNELHHGPANGVRSIIEDKKGKFWFSNTSYLYDVYQSSAPDGRRDGQGDPAMTYRREKGISDPDGPKDGGGFEYMSIAKDHDGVLWIVTWGGGVYRYDGTGLSHYPVRDGEETITLFSIYKDNQGGLWLGTHEAGAYTFNGKTFEKFTGKTTGARPPTPAE